MAMANLARSSAVPQKPTPGTRLVTSQGAELRKRPLDPDVCGPLLDEA